MSGEGEAGDVTKWMLMLLKVSPVVIVVAGLVVGRLAIKDMTESSAIVNFVKHHGAGNVESASVSDLSGWFVGGHTVEAMTINPQCQDISKHVPNATWPSSTEGRVCRAAAYAVELEAMSNIPFKAVN